MLASITNNQDISFALALVALILAAIVVAQSHLMSIIGWSCVAGFLSLVLIWWP